MTVLPDPDSRPDVLTPVPPSEQLHGLSGRDWDAILAQTGRLPRIEELRVFEVEDGIAIDRDVRIPMPDGVTLSANVYRPRSGEKVPVIMCMTLYNKDNGPEKFLPANSAMRQSIGTGSGELTVSSEAAYEGPDPDFWVPKGYTFVIVDARGTGRSGGENVWFTRQLGDDYAAAIEWAADQPWSSGKVGTNGVSYLAISQYHAAARRPRGLAAMIAWEGLSDLYRDLAFHGGIPETAFFPWWTSTPRPLTPGTFDAPQIVEEGSPTFQNFCENLWEPLQPSQIDTPLLQCGAWSNQGLHSRGSFNFFEEVGSTEKWLFTHGRAEWTVYSNDEEALQWQLAFFERYLKGDDAAMDGFPRVRLEVRKNLREHVVQSDDAWPPRSASFHPFYLDATKGTLVAQAPEVVGSREFLATGGEVVSFTYTFDRDTEISGPVSLKLWISTDAGEDMDIFVRLRKFDIAGAETHFLSRENDVSGIVSSGWLRASHRKLDKARSRPERPFLAHDGELPVLPNEIYEVEIEILPSSTLFEAGSRLLLSISEQDIFSNRLCQHKKLRNRGNHKIFTGGQRSSRLLRPIVRRA